jgi:hypothetical protein
MVAGAGSTAFAVNGETVGVTLNSQHARAVSHDLSRDGGGRVAGAGRGARVVDAAHRVDALQLGEALGLLSLGGLVGRGSLFVQKGVML